MLCAKCGSKTMLVCNRFLTLPRKLLLSVNRYSKEEKITKVITPPDVLHLKRFLEDSKQLENMDTEYILAGQILHIGDSKNSGHYICQVYCEDGKWREYDDQRTRGISFRQDIQSVTSPAYIFAFNRRNSAGDVAQ